MKWIVLLALAGCQGGFTQPRAQAQLDEAFFRCRVQPILGKSCAALACHGDGRRFYRVFARNMRDLGTPVLPRSFFETLQSTFGERVVFTAVFTADGIPAAASCCLQWRDEVEVTWASSLREFNKLSPNMLLYGTMMEHAIGRGVRTFNFGRSTPGAATHRFKQQWGGVDIPLPWASWSRVEDAGTPSADGAGLRLAQAMWKHVPLFVANRLGPVLSRHLP